MSDPIIIAIDGPAGSGKSTLARALASRLSLSTLDTGASYRAVAAEALARGVDPTDADAVASIARDAVLEVDRTVTIDGRDVTTEIRTDAVNRAVSIVAANPSVRAALVVWQRSWIAQHGGGVVEGRDIGTVVFPDATIKLFLDASAEERARRRSEEGREGIERRDRLDSTRVASPLAMAEDAFAIDTTERGVDEIVEMVLERLRAVDGGGGER